ncbi:exopolysaccharide biosynthesis protein [soil metagenome]
MTAIIERRKERLRLRREAKRGVSYGLEAWLDSDLPTTLGTLTQTFGEKILAAACLALMAPSALPIPTGGATHVFDVIAIVFAAQMAVARRNIWLPAKWERRKLGKGSQKALRYLIRFVRQCERISKPRLARLINSRLGGAVLGLAIAALVVAAFLSPPFSGLDTLPSLGVVLIALGILLEDAVFVIGGLAVGTLGVSISIIFGVQATHFISNLF